MVEITVKIPALLEHCVNDRPQVIVLAATVQQAIDNLLQDYPLLETHIYDQEKRQRPHVLIYHNDEDIHWLPNLHHPLKPGDTLTILQAVSGG